jgi:tRNA G37 N-methylase Trm5
MNRWLRWSQLVPVPVLRGPARGALWTLYPYSSYWRKGGAEPVTERAILSLGQLAGRTCWDLGAHFGFYSLVFAKLLGPAGQVVAFEPDPVSFRRLQLHARLNRLRNLVAFEAAAGSTSHVAKLVVNHGQGATTSHLPYPGEQVESTSAVV